jgi:hypothetical protein
MQGCPGYALGDREFDQPLWGGGSIDGAFMDTAAILMNLDLIVTSETATAHLAGALGVPLRVPLPFMPDWRWPLDRDGSLWYPRSGCFARRVPAIGPGCSSGQKRRSCNFSARRGTVQLEFADSRGTFPRYASKVSSPEAS